MATVHSLSNSQAAGSSSARGPHYIVSTRELSEDFSRVGPEEASRELGPIDKERFLQLLEKLVAIDTMQLVDGDPQMFVTVRSGRFLVQPQGGKLLVRPVNALDMIFFKLSPAEVPPFLDGVPIAPPAPPPGSTLIGAAVARAETVPAVEIRPAAPVAKKSLSLGLLASVMAVVLVGGGLAWFFLLRSPSAKPAPAAATSPASAPATRPKQLDPITSPAQLDALKKRVVGNYATGGPVAERMLELRSDGTFRYQDFGTGAAAPKGETGSYTIEAYGGAQPPAIRAAALGLITLRDENSLVVRNAVFTRFSLPEQ